MGSTISTTRASAQATVRKLIDTHRQTIADIDRGHIFFKNGQDISAAIRKHCVTEIDACEHILVAMDYMKAGDIKRAADLCSQIEAHLPRIG
jgi:hypothetical protein